MLKKMKAIMIVRRMIIFSEELIDGAKSEKFIEINNFAAGECIMMALAVTFSNFYTGNSKLGDAIIKESISGSWRTFYSQNYKEEYKQEIERLSEEWKRNTQIVFGKTDLSDIQKLNMMYYKICQSAMDYLSATHTKESEQFFALAIIGVRNYIAAVLKKV